MISEFSMHAVPKNRRGVILFLVLISAGVILTVISGQLEFYRGVVGIIGLISLVGALYVYTRFVIREYYYDITLAEGEPLLVVRELIGKRGSVMCRVSLADVKRVELVRLGEKSKKKSEAGYTKYSYLITLGAPEAVCLTVSSRYEKSEILLEGGLELANLLDSYAREAAAGSSAYDEE